MKKAKLLWMDLEMTGLDPQKDRILEVAVIATDWQFNVINQMTAVVKVPEQLMKERMVGEFWERNKKSYEALVSQNKEGRDTSEVEKELLEFIDANFGKEVYLAGNSIHQDKRFIVKEWPELDRRLHYRMFDVSAWKIYFENVLNKKFTKREAHRALDDIEGSIEEIKYYLVDRKKTVEVRTDRNLSKLLREQYESVMVSRYFGNGGIEIVMSGQIPLDEIYDMVRLSYNLTKEIE